jgi:KipI family sensor histidine kinase inhibitor
MRLLDYGDRAVLIEVDGPPAALREALLQTLAGHAGIEDLVPAARTLLVRFDPRRIDRATLNAAIAAATVRADQPDRLDAPRPAVIVPVHYDGPDLDAVAAGSGLSTDEVIARHIGAEYVVAFCGFAPGFAYLTGLDPRLHVARLDSPRAAVPAGAVGVAGEYTAAYPRSSPGGWRLIGRTDAALWDLNRPDPALLTPGARVRFEATR